MNEKICVVSGATSGIGKAISAILAARRWNLVLIGRNEQKGQALVEALIRETGNEQVEFFTIDLSSQKQIKKSGALLQQRYPRIDVLINNAAQWT
jgi:short-subunit dehydrogenase